MAMKQSSSFDDLELNADINVTPFIDVILVLLIIFMVAAPLATSDIGVQLPSLSAPAQQRPDKPIYLSIKSDGTLYMSNEQISIDNVISRLERETNNNKEEKIFIRGDKGASYGIITALLSQLQKAGYLKIGLVGLEGTQ